MSTLKAFCNQQKFNLCSITYYVCWKYLVCLIFAIFDDYENFLTKIFLTKKIYRITVYALWLQHDIITQDNHTRENILKLVLASQW